MSSPGVQGLPIDLAAWFVHLVFDLASGVEHAPLASMILMRNTNRI